MMDIEFRLESEWGGCLTEWWWSWFGLKLVFWRHEKGNYSVVGPELWLGSVRLFGLGYSGSLMLPNDSRNVFLTLCGFTLAFWWGG